MRHSGQKLLRGGGIEINSLPPIALEFHWCASCNYNCIHCSYGQRRQNKSRLSHEVITQTIEDLKTLGTKAVYLSGGGEPTTLSKWESYAQSLIDSQIEVALITNSVAIKPQHYELLRQFNYIAVSVYSTKEEQYKAIVGANHFQGQFELPSKLKVADSKLIVGARCVINSINYKEIFNTYQKAMQKGFDYIIFIPAVDYEKRRIDLSQEQKEDVLNQIEKGLSQINPATTNLLNVRNNGISHYGASYLPKLKKSVICNAIMMRSNAFVNYDGEVYLCQPLIGDKLYSLGNLNEKRFKDLWNSPRHNEVIARLHEKFAKGACENCRAISYNISIDRALQSIKPDIIPNDNFL
ncbi:radical SAM/SPASM domain-containing protein [Helicobacter marmotae]|uniref:radical SAM/SPASM domain-containing protein n=1 Tax=Helicobacter marmotae TaxID=152490 RepID=UPI001F2123AE|nr:radical SAM protein [Helicobacter marmotae]